MHQPESLQGAQDKEWWVNFFFNGHLTAMYYLWMAADIPILVGLFGKFFNLSYKIHSISMNIVTITTVVAITAQYFTIHLPQDLSGLPKIAKKPRKVDLEAGGVFGILSYLTQHDVLAKIIFGLILVQFVSGINLESLYLKKNSAGTVIFKKVARTVHLVLGILIWLSAKTQVYKMSDTDDFGWIDFNIFLIWMIGVPVIAIFLRIMMFLPKFRRVGKVKEEARKALNLTETQKRILEELGKGRSPNELKQDFPGKYVFLYEEKVYDLTSYQHPGGQVFWETQNWKDVSRLMNGGRVDETTGISNNHSAAAYIALRNHYIGSLKHSGGASESVVAPTIEGQSVSNKSTPGQSIASRWVGRSLRWSVEAAEPAGGVRKVILAREGQSGVNGFSLGFSDFGKFFRFRGAKGEKQKADAGRRGAWYYPLTGISQKSQKYREWISTLISTVSEQTRGVEEFDGFREANKRAQLAAITPENHKNKNSAQDSETQNLASIGKSIKLLGPFGTGLELPETLEHKLVIIAEGSNGIAPLTEFFDFLYKRTAAEILANAGNESAASIISGIKDFDRITKTAKVSFFGDFKNKAECLAYGLVKDLSNLNSEHGLELFRAQICIDDRDGVTQQDLQSFVSQASFDALLSGGFRAASVGELPVAERVVVSGGFDFSRKIWKLLEALGYPKGRVVYL